METPPFPSPHSGSAAGTAARGPGANRKGRGGGATSHELLVPRGLCSPHAHTCLQLLKHSQSHPDTLLKTEPGLQDSRTNQSPLGALQTPVFPLSPPFPVCICSICPHTRLTGSPASRVCAAGDTKPVLSVPEPQQPSPGWSALPQCCLSTSCSELSALPAQPFHIGQVQAPTQGTGTP